MQLNARRRRIIDLIRSRTIANQQELVAALEAAGEAVTQATVSRDLRALGIAKGPAGYLPPRETAGVPWVGADDEVTAHSVISIALADSLVVINTLAGHANAVAIHLDHLRPPEMVGSIAGDDTIFLATAGHAAARRLRERLCAAFEIDAAA